MSKKQVPTQLQVSLCFNFDISIIIYSSNMLIQKGVTGCPITLDCNNPCITKILKFEKKNETT